MSVDNLIHRGLRAGYVSRPSIGVELAPDAMSESLGMPGAMVMKAIPSLWSRK